MSSNDWTDTDSSDSMDGTASIDDDGDQSQTLPSAVTEAEAESTGPETDKTPFLDTLSFQCFPASLTRRMGIMPCPVTVADVEAAEVLASGTYECVETAIAHCFLLLRARTMLTHRTDPATPPSEPSPDPILKPYADLTPSERRYRHLLRVPAILWLFAMFVLGTALAMVLLVLLFVVGMMLWDLASGIFMLAAWIVMVVCNALSGILGWIGAKLGGVFGVVTTDAVSPAH